jgi:hypothetical protein
MVYSLTNDSSVIRDADGACIPPDDRNADWKDYQAWLGAGNTPTPYVAPPPLDALSAWDVISAKILFNHENRIRALEGKAAITAAQFRTAVKALTPLP